MNREAFSELSICLRCKPAGTSMEWSPSVAKYYHALLLALPDEAVGPLIQVIGGTTKYKFRPEPGEIIDIWRKISAPKLPLEADQVMAKIYALERKFGAYPVQGPDGVWKRGEPVWTDKIIERVIASFGGWVAFCEDSSPSGVRKGQLRAITTAILNGDNNDDVMRLRESYRLEKAEKMIGLSDVVLQLGGSL